MEGRIDSKSMSWSLTHYDGGSAAADAAGGGAAAAAAAAAGGGGDDLGLNVHLVATPTTEINYLKGIENTELCSAWCSMSGEQRTD